MAFLTKNAHLNEGVAIYIYIYLSEVIFEDPLKIPFKTSVKITSRGYFIFEVIFASRGYF